MKHVVASGCSFMARGVQYNAGDEITADIFSNPADFSAEVKKGRIVEADAKIIVTAAAATVDELAEQTLGDDKAAKKGKK